MRQRLLELEIRGRLLAADLASALRTRARSARGQTTVEWLAVMVGFVALVTVLAGSDSGARRARSWSTRSTASSAQADDKV